MENAVNNDLANATTAAPTLAKDRLMTMTELKRCVALSKSTIYKMIANGTFPKPIKLAPTSSRWIEREIMAWIAERKNDR